MDKTTPRWRNVPALNKNAQITVIRTCFEMVPDGNLCINMDSIHFPSTAVTTGIASLNTPLKVETVKNQCKFATRALPCVVLTVKNKLNKKASYAHFLGSLDHLPMFSSQKQ